MRLGRAYPVSRIVSPPPKFRVPLYDNSAISSAQSALANNTAFTWGHTVGGDYGIIVVAGNIGGTTSDLTVPATVTLGGVTLSELGGRFANDTTGSSFFRVFAASGIPSGGQTASVTLNQGGTNYNGWASSYTFTNVASAGALQTAAGNSTTGSVSVPVSAATDLVFGGVIRSGVSGSLSAFTLTQRQTGSAGTTTMFICGDGGAASNPFTVSATLALGSWSAFGLDLIGS